MYETGQLTKGWKNYATDLRQIRIVENLAAYVLYKLRNLPLKQQNRLFKSTL